MAHQEKISLIIIALFVLEIFSPLAFSAPISGAITPPASTTITPPTGFPVTQPVFNPSPSTTSPFNVPGVCEVNEMTPEQTQYFWQQTQGFRADEINALQGADQLANRPSQNVNININVNQPGEGVYELSTISRFLGLDEAKTKEAARSLGKAPTDRVTQEQAQQLAKKYGKGANEMSDFINSLKGSPSEERAAYENYKLKLLSGAEIPVKSLQKNIENTASCMINSAHIQGKVSYVSSLSEEIAISFDGAPSKANTANRLWAEKTNADLDFQGANTLVIPKHYEELVKKLHFWIATDTLLTAAQMATFFGGVSSLDKNREKLREIEDRATKYGSSPQTVHILDAIHHDTIKSEIYSLESRTKISRIELEQSLDSIEGGLAARYSPRDPITGNIIPTPLATLQTNPGFAAEHSAIQKTRNELAGTTIAPAGDATSIFNNHAADIRATGRINEEESREIAKAKIRTRADSDYTKTLEELNGREYETDLKKMKANLQRRTGDFWFRTMLGMAWLGPGRFVFELTDAINFVQLPGKGFSDNYILVMANNQDVAGEFRRATNWVLSGTVTDAISDLTEEGVPTAAYWVGNLFFVNQPVEDATTPRVTQSTTSFLSQTGKWRITTNWAGKSDALLAEELTAQSEYARLPLEVKGKAWGMKIRARREFETFYQTMTYLVPILNWRLLGTEQAAVTGIRLVAYDQYVSNYVNPASFKKDEQCDSQVIDDYVAKYRALTIANQVIGWAPIFGGWAKGFATSASLTASFAKKAGIMTGALFDNYVTTIVKVIDPITLAQGYYASEALEYASACKDDQYTVIAYQSLKKKGGVGLGEQLKAVSTNDLLSKLNVGKAALGIGEQVNTASLNEYVNLRTELEQQHSDVNARKLYYLHFGDASIQWLPSLQADQPAACMRKCLDSDTSTTCLDETGAKKCDKEGNCVGLANKDRALNHLELDNYAATLIPNKYITTTLAGCPGSVFQIDGLKNLELTASQSCAGAQCMRTQLQYLTGRPIGSDLTASLGHVTGIYTSSGSGQIADGIIRFNAFNPINDKIELRSPGIEVIQKATSSDEALLKQAAALIVNGDGSVVLSGYLNGQTIEQANVGELRTIMTERGRINYLGNGQVQIFLHTLAQIDASLIRGINTAPVQANECSDAPGLTGIKITNLNGQPGVGDAAAAELNSALQKIQGCSGMHILETADKKYIFTKDENGNPILRVIDKNTGEVTDYKINGPLRQEGNNIIVPTDKGDFKFNLGMGENGQPMLSAIGPNGLNELLPLLAARGLGGILMFDPRTGQWSGFNGQDLAMNPNFATRGQTISADSNGNVRGAPTDNLLMPASRRGTTSGNALASLPSWPEDNLSIIVLIIITLAGIAIVRFKRSKT